jgi:hypothetical protein
MDGFFVAKFKVMKRAKQTEEDEERSNPVVDEDVLQNVQFDEKEDERYIHGESPHNRSSGLRLMKFRGQTEAVEGERSSRHTSESCCA